MEGRCALEDSVLNQCFRERNNLLCVKGRKFNLVLKYVVRSEERKGLQRARRRMNQIV